jgi:predicted LPLAT superfamily acyltransferase
MVLTPANAAPSRNPGPTWGYRFLRLCHRWLPGFVFRRLRAAGTWAAVLVMPRQRAHSREYLQAVLGRPPSHGEVYRHFGAMTESLMLRLRVAEGEAHLCVMAPDALDFLAWIDSGGPMLLGTFHVGNSDLTGFLLARQGTRAVTILRRRTGNSEDTDLLGKRFGDWVRFVWVNQPEDFLFVLKEAMAGDGAVALQCDRADYSARSEEFDFMGRRRRFPITIYHLALIFRRPVILSFALSDRPGTSIVHASPRFDPRPGERRAEAMARAHEHFQAFLGRLERELRRDPTQWLNFIPLTQAEGEAA